MTKSSFDWNSIQNSLHALKFTTLGVSNVVKYIHDLDLLESEIYERQSSLARDYYTNPGDASARATLQSFYADIHPDASALVQACASRLSDVQDTLPEQWIPTLLPFIQSDEGKISGAIAELQGEAETYSSLSALVTYEYLDGQGDLLADRGSDDRSIRERAHRAMINAERIAAERKAELFVSLHAKRQSIARDAGFKSYADLAWSRPPLSERDYSRNDVIALRESVRRYIPGLLQILANTRKGTVGGARPWDDQIALDGKFHRSPIKDPDQALDAVGKILSELSPVLEKDFSRMRQMGVFNIAGPYDKYRQPITNYLPISGLPWVSCWYSGVSSSVFTLLHEVGHALHLYRIPKESLFRQHYPAKEYMEFVAQATETVSLPYLGHFFGEDSLPGVKLSLIERALKLIVNMTALDEFQERAYSLGEADTESLNEIYIDVLKHYPNGVDIDGIDDLVKFDWASWHVIVHPFYNLEYVLAWIGALTMLTGDEASGALLEKASARAQDAPTSSLFRDVGLRIPPTEADVAHLAAQLTSLVHISLNALSDHSIVGTK